MIERMAAITACQVARSNIIFTRFCFYELGWEVPRGMSNYTSIGPVSNGHFASL